MKENERKWPPIKWKKMKENERKWKKIKENERKWRSNRRDPNPKKMLHKKMKENAEKMKCQNVEITPQGLTRLFLPLENGAVSPGMKSAEKCCSESPKSLPP